MDTTDSAVPAICVLTILSRVFMFCYARISMICDNIDNNVLRYPMGTCVGVRMCICENIIIINVFTSRSRKRKTSTKATT